MRSRLVPLVAVLVLAAAWAGAARADVFIPVAPVVDPCTTAAPAATLMLGHGVNQVSTTSWGGLYAAAACPRFVVDVDVPANSSPYDTVHYDSTFGLYANIVADGYFGLPTTQADCEAYVGYVSVYVRGGRISTFERKWGGTLHGLWKPMAPGWVSACFPIEDPGFVEVPGELSPPFVGTVTYRVAVAAKVGTWRTVRVQARHTDIIW